MLDNIEFWGLLFSVVAGFGVEMKYLMDIREKVSNNTERITAIEKTTQLEFDKCRLHTCGGVKNE